MEKKVKKIIKVSKDNEVIEVKPIEPVEPTVVEPTAENTTIGDGLVDFTIK